MANADFVPFLAMVTVQVGYAGMMITSKLAMDGGMNPFVLVTYRQVFATLATKSRENRDQGITWMWMNATAAARRRNHRKSQRNLLTIISLEQAGETAVTAEDHTAKEL